MDICFATNNEHKLSEVRDLVGNQHNILSLSDIGCDEELPEDYNTMEDNSSQKAEYVYKNYRINCFSDDTGLECYGLNMEPGVRSARYAGDHKSNEQNISLLLKNLESKPEKRARFRTVVTLVLNGKTWQFEGIVEGIIIQQRFGKNGFGYDPIFAPLGELKTFAEMTNHEKNKISHRAIAMQQLVDHLKTI